MDLPTPAAGTSPAPSTAPAAPAPTPAPAAAPTPSPAPAATSPAAAPAANAPKSMEGVAKVLTSAERRAVALGQVQLKDVLAAKMAAAKSGTPAAPAAPAAEAPAAAAPAPQGEAPDPGETPAAAPAAPEGGTPAGETPPEELPDRFRFKDPADQAIAYIAKARGVSLIEATRIYQAQNPAAAPTAPAQPAAPAAPAEPAPDPGLQEYDSQITTLQSRIKKLSEDRAKAREDVDTDKADKLSDDIAEAKADLKLLENEKKGYQRNREQAAVQTAQQQINASRDRGLAQYPELQSEGSMHRMALDQYVQRALHDPARANEFKDHGWPERLVTEFASKYGLKKGGSAASTPAASTTPAPAPAASAQPSKAAPVPSLRQAPRQVPGAKLMTSADGNAPSPAAPTAEDLRANLSKMTSAQRRELAVHAISKARRG